MLQALADGETDPAALAALAAPRLRATPAQPCDAFHVGPTLHPVYRRLLKLTLEELRVIEDHLGTARSADGRPARGTPRRPAAPPRAHLLDGLHLHVRCLRHHVPVDVMDFFLGCRKHCSPPPHRSAGGAARRNLAALQPRLFAYKTNGRHPAGHFGVLFFSDAF
jgi:hypothetical protein